MRLSAPHTTTIIRGECQPQSMVWSAPGLPRDVADNVAGCNSPPLWPSTRFARYEVYRLCYVPWSVAFWTPMNDAKETLTGARTCLATRSRRSPHGSALPPPKPGVMATPYQRQRQLHKLCVVVCPAERQLRGDGAREVALEHVAVDLSRASFWSKICHDILKNSCMPGVLLGGAWVFPKYRLYGNEVGATHSRPALRHNCRGRGQHLAHSHLPLR